MSLLLGVIVILTALCLLADVQIGVLRKEIKRLKGGY